MARSSGSPAGHEGGPTTVQSVCRTGHWPKAGASKAVAAVLVDVAQRAAEKHFDTLREALRGQRETPRAVANRLGATGIPSTDTWSNS